MPNLLPQNRLFGFITIMALLTGVGKIIDAITDPLVAIAVALCLFPLIVKISRKYNKKIPLVAASVIFTVVFALIYFGDKIAAMAPGHELFIGIGMGIVVAFPFAAINILPQSVISDIIQQDSLKTGVNREGIFSAVKTFIEKIASSIAMGD